MKEILLNLIGSLGIALFLYYMLNKLVDLLFKS